MYEIFALRYAEKELPACQLLYRDASHAAVKVHFYCWLVLGGRAPMLVDAGCTAGEASRRGLAGYVSPVELVRRLGLAAEDVRTLLVTHLHWDHVEGHTAFPNAELLVQEEELAFWSSPVANEPVYRDLASAEALRRLTTLRGSGRLRTLRGETEVLPGIRVHRVGGHSVGLQVVSIETARGRAALASDAAHFYRNLETRVPVQIYTDLAAVYSGFDALDRIAGNAGLVVAGHDPLVAERFTRIDDAIVRVA